MEFTIEEKKLFSKLGKSRFKYMTDEEKSKYMSQVRTKGIANKNKAKLVLDKPFVV